MCHIQTYDRCHAWHTELNQFEVSCFVGVGAVCYLIILFTLFSNILASLIVLNFEILHDAARLYVSLSNSVILKSCDNSSDGEQEIM